MKVLIFFLIIALSASHVFSQESGIHFDHYTTKDGLPVNSIKDITQDSLGYMWFATEEGLTSFDGYTFKVYKHDLENPESVRSTDVRQVLASRNGNIWVGGFDGLDSYDPKTEVFHHLDLNVPVSYLKEDSSGNLWISTPDHGVRVYHPKDSSFTAYQHDPADANSLHGNLVKSRICEDRNGDIWIGSGGALQSLDLSSRTFTSYPFHTIIRTILEDSEGNIWLCDEAGALIRLNSQDNSMSYFLRNEDTYGSVGDWFNTLFRDSQGNLWIGTGSQGLILFDAESGEVNRYEHDLNDPYSISSNTINNIYEDRAGNLWIATDHGGVNFVGFYRQPFMTYKHNPDDPQSLSANDIRSFFERPNGDVWVGTFGGGLNLFDHSNKTFTNYPIPSWGNNAGSVLEDSQGYVWCDGLIKFIPPLVDKPTKYEWFLMVNSIIEDSKGSIWIGFASGLCRYDRQQDQFYMYTHYDSIESSLSNQMVVSVFEDKEQKLWIATMGGLDIYDRENDNFNHFYSHPTFGIWEDLDGNIITIGSKGMNRINVEDKTQGPIIKVSHEFTTTGALMDGKGNIWLPTKSGDIIRFNIETQTYIVFDDYHENEFNYRSQILSSTGEMYFGGKQGFVVFHPDSIKDNLHVPPVVITDFKLFNQSVPVAFTKADSMQWESPLVEGISFTQEMTLPYDYNIFSLEFSALNYVQTYRNQYKYKLEGFNQEWMYTSASNRVATYTNLNPGEYTFMVSGSNNDGIWNDEGKSIQITILPPWWLSWWAYILYVLVFICLSWLIIRDIRRRDRIKAHMQIEHLELRKMQELDELKNQFFTNISHEFRTPLTLILGPLKQLYEGTFKGNQETVFIMMIRNCNRLLKLINQLLDFSKLDAGVIPLRTSKMDIVVFLKLVFANFESIAQSRKIKYFFQSDTSELMVFLDTKHFEKVIINLLSNAFKFTLEDCEIFLKVSKNVKDPVIDKGEGIVEIQVIDSGAGIEKEKLPYIFDRFYQADGANSRVQEGAGIGLALVKELVKLHYGSIQVVSKKGKGASFIIHLPLGKTHLNEEEIIDASKNERYENEFDELSQSEENSNENELQNGNPPIILIIDDNADMRSYIREILIEEYRIIDAPNGSNGLKKAIELIPDLIVTDVMMPELDGYALCQKLKTDERTSHIPVILLTAKADQKAKIEGYETGADDYITKPFNHDELRIRIKNLIEQREELRQRFNKNISLGPGELAITSADEKFLTRAIKIIDDHIEDPNLGAEFFAKEIGLSRSQLHRKLKALTDHSASEFIRSYRLNFSRQLLDKQYGNIAEITYAVGFNNPSYFAECFKKQFGVLPSKYVENKSSSTQKKY